MAFYYRGFCHRKLGKAQKGCEDWKKALELGYKEAEKNINDFCK
jgi:hypothetical protein